MIDIYSKYDNMHENRIFYALICFNNHIISCIICMLSRRERNIQERERLIGERKKSERDIS